MIPRTPQDRRARRPVARLVALVPALGLVIALTLGTRPAAADTPMFEELELAMDFTLVLRDASDDRVFLGSATLWGDGDRIVTAAHVLNGKRAAIVVDRIGRRAEARVIRVDEKRDIAVLELSDPVFGRGIATRPGDPWLAEPVYALGAPLGAEFTLTHGVISAPPRQVEPSVPVALIQHDAATNPGSSGGPLVTEAGEMIGLNARIADGSRLFAGLSYAIPVDVVAGVVDSGLPVIPTLGLSLRPVGGPIARALGLTNGAGALVDHVAAEGHAARAGLKPGDVILGADGIDLTAPGDLSMILDARTAEKLPLRVWRAGSTMTLTLNLAASRNLSNQSLGTAATTGQIGRITTYGWDTLGLRFRDGTTQVETLTRTSPVYFAGVVVDDVILGINGDAVDGATIAERKIDGAMLLLIARGTRTFHLLVDPWGTAASMIPLGGGNALDPAVSVF